MQLFDRVSVLVLERADHDPVGLLEVADRRALGGELRVRDVADEIEPALVEAMANHRAGADGNGALQHDDGAPIEPGELVDDRPDGREVGVTGVCRRRTDRDVQEVGVRDRLADIERVRQPVGVSPQHLLEPGLPDRNLAGLKPRHAIGEHVAHDDDVAELCEACAGDETDVARTEDSDLGHARNLPT